METGSSSNSDLDASLERGVSPRVGSSWEEFNGMSKGLSEEDGG